MKNNLHFILFIFILFIFKPCIFLFLSLSFYTFYSISDKALLSSLICISFISFSYSIDFNFPIEEFNSYFFSVNDFVSSSVSYFNFSLIDVKSLTRSFLLASIFYPCSLIAVRCLISVCKFSIFCLLFSSLSFESSSTL